MNSNESRIVTSEIRKTIKSIVIKPSYFDVTIIDKNMLDDVFIRTQFYIKVDIRDCTINDAVDEIITEILK